jgi:predicted dehydrogenase
MSLKRREFISQTIKGAAVLAVGNTALSAKQVLGANERIRIALLGCGGRGRFVTRNMIEQGAELTYLCDLHDGRLDKAEQFLSEVQQRKPKKIKDMRKLFEAKDLDAGIIATPDHWHAPASVLAVQAGKDVYVEKPHAYDMRESLLMIEAASKNKQIIQSGTQNRSAPYNLACREYVKSGKLGKIGLVKVFNLLPGRRYNFGKSAQMPKDFDWDYWLGPAPVRAYHDEIFEGGWHRFWDFSGGDLADDGIHQLDLALMLLGDPGLPLGTSCTGGRFVNPDDDGEVPDVQAATYEFEEFVLTFEMTKYSRYMQKTTATIRRNDELPYWTQNSTRIELYGSELMMTVGRHGGGWQVTTSGGKVVEQMFGRPADVPHVQNFLQCVKERKQPTADVSIAHSAFALINMANIAHRAGDVTLKYDAANGKFSNNERANKLLRREYRKGYEISN